MYTDQKDLAVMIATLLDRDPIMASNIKKYISETRLVEILGLKTTVATEPAGQTIIQDPNPLGEMGATGK